MQASLKVINRSRSNRRGMALPMMALLMGGFLGFMGLIFDGGHLYFEKRRMQAAADAGAVGGAHEVKRGNLSRVDGAGKYDAGLNGYTHGQQTVDVQVNHPPASGANIGSAQHVEVVISKTVPTTLMRMLGANQAVVQARSVAGLENNATACVISLDPDDKAAVKVSGGGQLNANCGLMANSSHSEGLEATGGGNIHAGWIGVHGGFGGGGTYDPPPQAGALPMLDPLAGTPHPDYSSLPVFNVGTITSSVTLDPGRYTGGFKVNDSDVVVDFNPGLYVLDSGMDVTSGTLRGTEVSFYNIGDQFISVSGGDLELSAPTSGPYQGMLFWGDPNAPNLSPGHRFRGNSSSSFTGAVYFPTQHIDWAGSSETLGEWTMIVSNTIDISGNAFVQQINGPPPGVLPQLTTVTTVE